MRSRYNVAVKSDTSHSPRIQRRQQRNREAILDATEQLFAEHGLQGLRIEDIAERADVSVGTVYGQFGNKDGVTVAAADRILDRAEQYMAQAYLVTDSPIEQVAAAGAAYHQLLTDHPFLARFLVAELPSVPETPPVTAIRERISTLHRQLAATIDAAVTQGQATQLDAESFATFLLGAWNGVHALGERMRLSGAGPGEITDCLDQARRILISGIANEPAGPWRLLPVPRPGPAAGP